MSMQAWNQLPEEPTPAGDQTKSLDWWMSEMARRLKTFQGKPTDGHRDLLLNSMTQYREHVDAGDISPLSFSST